MKRIIRAASALIITLISGCALIAHEATEGEILRVGDQTQISLSQMIGDLKGVRTIFVGEVHDRKSHHEMQRTIIRALKETGVSLAVGLEMFREADQKYLDQWIANALDIHEFKRRYYESWNFPWSLYGPLFLFAREKGIPLVGLNVSRRITRQVAKEGFASLKLKQREALQGVTCQVDAEYELFIRRSLGAHAHGDMAFVHFCEAQMVWDTAMALNLLRFLEKNPEKTIVALAGSGHAWKRGIAEQIRRRSSLTYSVVLPEIPGRLDRNRVSLDDADYLWIFPEESP